MKSAQQIYADGFAAVKAGGSMRSNPYLDSSVPGKIWALGFNAGYDSGLADALNALWQDKFFNIYPWETAR